MPAGGGCLLWGGVPAPGGVPVLGVPAPGEGACSGGVPALRGVETPRDSYCCGQYTSYWNAFLFTFLFVNKL